MSVAERIAPGCGPGAQPIPAPEGVSWILAVADVDRWLRTAQSGAELVYAHGDYLPDWGGTARHVGQLAQQRVVTPFPRRNPRDARLDYVARRRLGARHSGLPEGAGRTRKVVPIDATGRALFDAIEEAALWGHPCPSNRVLAAEVELSMPSVKRHLDLLQRDGLILVELVPHPFNGSSWRRVTVLASGQATTSPEWAR